MVGYAQTGGAVRTRGGIVRNLIKIFTLVFVLSGFALALAACSASVGDTSSSDGGSKTYTNDKYGFTMKYDASLKEGKSVGGTGAGGSSVFDIAFADLKGTAVDGDYIDGLQVSVYKLAREVKPAEVAKLKKEFQGVVSQLLGSVEAGTIDQPLEAVTVNGVPGFRLGYTYKQGGVETKSVTYFLVKGQNEYQVTAQASSANWDALKSKLEAAIQSFTVTQ
jgi:hypothetical protein